MNNEMQVTVEERLTGFGVFYFFKLKETNFFYFLFLSNLT